MKTVTCDLCGKTVDSSWGQKWSKFNRQTNTIDALSLQTVSLRDEQVDVCDVCTNSMIEWIEMEIATRPEEDDND